MNQCAQCAQEIHESATLCESCRLTALERLFDEASLSARPGSVASAPVKPIALLTAGTNSEPVTESAAVPVVPVVEHRPSEVETLQLASTPDDALPPPTMDELRQLTLPVPPTDMALAGDVSLARTNEAFDDWNIPGLSVLKEPAATSLSVSAPAPNQPVLSEAERVPAATSSGQLPISAMDAMSGPAASAAQPVEDVSHVATQSVQPSMPLANDFLAAFSVTPLPAASVPLPDGASEAALAPDPAAVPAPGAVSGPPAVTLPLAGSQAPAVPYLPEISQPLVTSEPASAPSRESVIGVPVGSTFSADRWLEGLEQPAELEPPAAVTTALVGGGAAVTEPLVTDLPVTDRATVPVAPEFSTPPPIEPPDPRRPR